MVPIANRHAQARAHVWASIMRNYTVRKPDRQYRPYLICVNGCEEAAPFWYLVPTNLGRKELINTGNSFKFPVAVANTNSLPFVSCGTRGYHSYPIHQLTKVFDVYVWLLLILEFFGAFPLMLHISSKIMPQVQLGIPMWNMANYTITAWQLLLEQGNKSIRNCKGRFGIIFIILGGVVLSNSYKNSKVYNVIAPN